AFSGYLSTVPSAVRDPYQRSQWLGEGLFFPVGVPHFVRDVLKKPLPCGQFQQKRQNATPANPWSQSFPASPESPPPRRCPNRAAARPGKKKYSSSRVPRNRNRRR